MDNFFNYFKEKLELPEESMILLRNIVLNDNTTFAKENFNIFNENKKNPITDENKFFYCCLFLYCLDIHREFKKRLLSNIAPKYKGKDQINIYLQNFFDYTNLSLLSTKDINDLKYKILILNNIFDITMKNIKSENEDEIIANIKKKFYEFFIKSLKDNEISLLVTNSNDEIGLIIILIVYYY